MSERGGRIYLRLSLLVQLAWRNLWRQWRRNAVLLLTISVAVSGVVVLNALIRGMQSQMTDIAVNNLTGHMKILAPQYLDDPGIHHTFNPPADWRKGLPLTQLMGTAERIRIPAVIKSEREARAVELVGIDPASEGISFLSSVAIAGEMLRDASDRRLLIGKSLAEDMQVQAGRRVVLITQGMGGAAHELGFRIAGIFDATGEGLENGLVFGALYPVQQWLGVDGITEVSVRLRNGEHISQTRTRLADSLPGLEISTWLELQPQVAAMIASVNVSIFILMLVVMAALVFGLVNALVTAVMERTRELGLLRMLGMRNSSVVCQVVVECLVIMAAGVIAGLILGCLLCLWLAGGIDLSAFAGATESFGMGTGLLKPQLLLQDLMMAVAISMVFGALASIIPARRVVKMKPLEALRR